MKVDIYTCTVCGMKVWNKSALVQHVTTEKRKWGGSLAGRSSGASLGESWGIRRPPKHSLATILTKLCPKSK